MRFNTDMVNCEYVPLPNLISLIVDNRGKSVPTCENGIPLIATNCIRNNELYPVFERIRYVSNETYSSWFRAHPEPGDIIFVNKGTPGRVCMVPDPVNFCIAQDMMAFRVNDKIVYNKYLFAVLRSSQFQSQISNYNVGTMIPHFKKGDLDKLFIPVPSREIQTFIGDLYFKFSLKIELNNQINKNLQSISQLLFKQWFVDFDFLNQEGLPYKSSGGEMVDSELGMIPKGWKVISLDNICHFNNGTLSSKDSLDYINYLDTSNITENKINIIQKIDCISEKVPSRAKRKVMKDSIVYSTVRPNQVHYGIIKKPVENMIVSTGFVVVDSKLDFLKNDLVYLWLTQNEITDKLQAIAETSTSTYPSIKPSDIKSLKIVFPSRKILDDSSNLFSEINFNIATLQEENKNLSMIRDTLLPKLMNGEIELDKLQIDF